MMKIRNLVLLGALPTCAFAQVANISRQDVDNTTGLLISSGLQNAAGVTYFDNDAPRTMLLVKNGSGGTLTATELTQQTSLTADRYGSVTLSNQAVTIGSGDTRLLGPFPSERWNTVNQTVGVSFSTVTGVSVTAVRVPK